jgi:hypothetical protein
MPRFVLLEHHCNEVHWDLMLETGAVLRTWAIDTPVARGACLPARALRDHRLIYLEYEGTISGDRGWVRRIDAGLYESLVWTPDLIGVVLSGTQLVGPAELRRVGLGCGAAALAWTFRLGNFD